MTRAQILTQTLIWTQFSHKKQLEYVGEGFGINPQIPKLLLLLLLFIYGKENDLRKLK